MLRFNVKCLLILSILCYLTHPVLSDCRNAFVPGFDYFPDKVYFEDDGKSSADLSVTYHNSYIIVNNKFSLNYSETYVLYCTANQPTLNDVPTATNYIQIPVTNVAVSDRAIVSFLEILGEERSIKYVADKSAITSPCLQKYNNLYETLNFANETQIQSVDVIFTYTPLMGGKYVQVSFDDSPALRKAEWFKFVSLFFNKTAIANEIFGKIQSNYLCHLDNLSHVPKLEGKTIAWVSLESDLTFTVRSTPFYVNITSDASGFVLDPQISDDIQTTDELHQQINDAYIVIDMSDLTAPHNTLDTWKHYFGYDNVSTLPRFLKEKRLYRTHKLLNNNGYDDWTESSGSRPDLILQDLIAMQYPSYQPNYIIRWFDKFAETGDNVIISGDSCNDSTFGLPKSDFGTCESAPFFGDKDNGHKHGDKDNKDKKKEKKVKVGVIIGATLTGSLVLLGLGTWAFIVARRKYRERFVKLRDEPVVQMNSVKEDVPLDSVKEVK